MKRRSTAAAMAALAVGIHAGTILAQSSLEHLLPYRGSLELDGVPVTGSYDFKFELYSSATEGDCDEIPIPESCLWQETIQAVEVIGGAFSVMLGAGEGPLPDAIFENGELYLGIRVAASGQSYARLGGRQRLLTVPSAVRAEGSKDYRVTGALFAGSAKLRGGVDIEGEARMSGRLTVNPHGGFSIQPVGRMTAQQVTAGRFTGTLGNLVSGGVRVYCNNSSAYQTDCVFWGDGTCGSGSHSVCGSPTGCRTGSVLQQISHGSCWSQPVNDHDAYCYHYLCIRQ